MGRVRGEIQGPVLSLGFDYILFKFRSISGSALSFKLLVGSCVGDEALTPVPQVLTPVPQVKNICHKVDEVEEVADVEKVGLCLVISKPNSSIAF